MASSTSKGNPASHRMSNLQLKTKRAASWARGQRKKPERIKAASEAMSANIGRLAEQDITFRPSGRKSSIRGVEIRGRKDLVAVPTNRGNGSPDRPSNLLRRIARKPLQH